jgi:hypothetical protein
MQIKIFENQIRLNSWRWYILIWSFCKDLIKIIETLDIKKNNNNGGIRIQKFSIIINVR